MNPRVLVITGYGINCDEETRFAFEKAGAKAEIVHINDIISKKKKVDDYHILAFPGGFSYGDNLGSGNAFANKVKNNLWNEISKFVGDKKLIIGICNGFQIITNLGLVPAQNKKYGEKQAALMHNDNNRYTCRWVDLKVANDSPWLKGMDTLSMPIAHGEGKFYAPENVLKKLNEKKQVALKYVQGTVSQSQGLPYNPNGALQDIAGITDETGLILGLMPHPERALFFTQLPDWTLQKEQLLREGKSIPSEGPGFKVFQNAVEYVRSHF
jgi:phosphoribosylformylglycinamidine synthase